MVNEDEISRYNDRKRFLRRCSSRFELFYGGSHAEILEFFENFEHLAKRYDAKNSDKVRALVELISGPALRVYNKMIIADQQSYREIKSTIINQLVVQDNPYAARKTYNTRKQNIKESVDEFFTDLQRLATIARQNYSQEQLKSICWSILSMGLKLISANSSCAFLFRTQLTSAWKWRKMLKSQIKNKKKACKHDRWTPKSKQATPLCCTKHWKFSAQLLSSQRLIPCSQRWQIAKTTTQGNIWLERTNVEMPFSQCVDENQYFHESRKDITYLQKWRKIRRSKFIDAKWRKSIGQCVNRGE